VSGGDLHAASGLMRQHLMNAHAAAPAMATNARAVNVGPGASAESMRL